VLKMLANLLSVRNRTAESYHKSYLKKKITKEALNLLIFFLIPDRIDTDYAHAAAHAHAQQWPTQ
jgi:hypothetical protein